MAAWTRRRAVIFLITTVSVSAAAQVYFPESITFSGAKQTQEELLAFTGLKPGRVSKEQMEAADQKLTATGLFLRVNYELDDDVLHYTLTPSPGVIPVEYDNLVWWDAATLNALVAKNVPLFAGGLYPGGPMRQKVVDALTALVAEKGVRATIGTSPVGDAHGTMVAMRFHIDSPRVEIASCRVEGAGEAWTAPIERLEESAAGKDFRKATPESLAAAVRAMYATRGYLDAAVTNPVWGKPVVQNGNILVPLTATVMSEGAQYSVSAVRFAGDAQTSVESFMAQSAIHAGDVADGDLVRQTEDLLKEPWTKVGYLEAKAEAIADIDKARRTVAYTFKVDPGEVYRMATLQLIGLNNRQERQVRLYWQIPRGAVFRPGLMMAWNGRYLRSRGEQLIVADQMGRMVPTYHFTENAETHTVDVTVSFHERKVEPSPFDGHPTWK